MSYIRTFTVALSLTALLWTLQALSQEVDLKAATDGRCDYWLKMLGDDPSERVEFTGSDSQRPKVKVLSDGKRWRIVLLAGAKKPLFGCTIIEGDGEMAP